MIESLRSWWYIEVVGFIKWLVLHIVEEKEVK